MKPWETILLVEDNEDDVFVFERVLRRARIGNPFRIVNDGKQAVEYLSGTGEYASREEFPLPFIVFLDLKLPYLNGFEVLAWIRARKQFDSAVVVVLTSSAEEKDHQRAYALGARSYLVKPPTPETLLDVAKSLESYWVARGESDPFRIGREPGPGWPSAALAAALLAAAGPHGHLPIGPPWI